MLQEQHFNNPNLKTIGKKAGDEKSNWTVLFSQFWLTHGVCAHVLSHFSCVWLFANLWPITHQASLSMAFSRHEYWSGLPCPSLGDLPNPGIEPRSPALQADSFPSEPPRKSKNTGVGSLSLFQQICPTQELNQSLLHCRWVLYQGFPGGSDSKASACNAGNPGSIPGLGRSPGEGNSNPLLPRKFHGWRRLVGYSPWGHKESDMTEAP